MAQPQNVTINVTSTPAVGVNVGISSTTPQQPSRTTANPPTVNHKTHSSPGVMNFSDLKSEFNSHEQRNPIIMKLNSNDAHYGNNGWLADFWFYSRNNHRLLSLLPFCGAHPLHPFTKCERLNISFVTWTLAFLLTACFERYIQDADTRYYVSFFVGGIVLTLYDIILTEIAQCRCVQGDKVSKGVRFTAQVGSAIMMLGCCCHGLILAVAAILVLTLAFSSSSSSSSSILTPSPSSSSSSGMNVFVVPHAATFTTNFFAAKLCDLFVTSPLLLLFMFSCKRRREMTRS